MRRLLFMLVLLPLIGCADITPPTTGPTSSVDPQAAVNAHVAATVAYLTVLLKDAAGSDASAIADVAEMRDTLGKEAAWLGVNANPNRVAIGFYREKVEAALAVTSAAVATPTRTYVIAALDAVQLVCTEGSLVADGD
jgi:hypothetical protein